MRNDEKLLVLIAQWMYYNEKLAEVNKYLFNHTELFEKRYCSDFQNDLFRFFAGKITRFTNENNKIRKLLSSEQNDRLNFIKLGIGD